MSDLRLLLDLEDSEVLDGDTFIPNDGGPSVRLGGDVDAPETPKAFINENDEVVYDPGESGAGEATAGLRYLLDQADDFEIDDGQESYGRRIGRVSANGQDVSDQLAQAGLVRSTGLDPQSQTNASIRQARDIMPDGHRFTDPELRRLREQQREEQQRHPVDISFTGESSFRREQKGIGGKSFERGIDQTQAMYYGAIKNVGDLLGSESISKWARTGSLRNLQEAMLNPPEVGSLDNAEDLADYATFFYEAVMEEAPSLLMDLGIGVATGGTSLMGTLTGKAMVGKALRRELGEEAFGKFLKARRMGKLDVSTGRLLAKGASEKTKRTLQSSGTEAFAKGVVRGGTASIFGQTVGESQLELDGEGVDAPVTALLTGAAKGSLELLGIQKMLGRFAREFGKPVAEIAKDADKLIRPSLRALKATGRVAGTGSIEGITEGIQTALDKLAVAYETGGDPFTPENISEIRDAMAAGFAVGSSVQGAGTGAAGVKNYVGDKMRQRAQFVEEENRKAREDGSSDEPPPPAGPTPPGDSGGPTGREIPAEAENATPTPLKWTRAQINAVTDPNNPQNGTVVTGATLDVPGVKEVIQEAEQTDAVVAILTPTEQEPRRVSVIAVNEQTMPLLQRIGPKLERGEALSQQDFADIEQFTGVKRDDHTHVTMPTDSDGNPLRGETTNEEGRAAAEAAAAPVAEAAGGQVETIPIQEAQERRAAALAEEQSQSSPEPVISTEEQNNSTERTTKPAKEPAQTSEKPRAPQKREPKLTPIDIVGPKPEQIEAEETEQLTRDAVRKVERGEQLTDQESEVLRRYADSVVADTRARKLEELGVEDRSHVDSTGSSRPVLAEDIGNLPKAEQESIELDRKRRLLRELKKLPSVSAKRVDNLLRRAPKSASRRDRLAQIIEHAFRTGDISPDAAKFLRSFQDKDSDGDIVQELQDRVTAFNQAYPADTSRLSDSEIADRVAAGLDNEEGVDYRAERELRDNDERVERSFSELGIKDADDEGNLVYDEDEDYYETDPADDYDTNLRVEAAERLEELRQADADVGAIHGRDHLSEDNSIRSQIQRVINAAMNTAASNRDGSGATVEASTGVQFYIPELVQLGMLINGNVTGSPRVLTQVIDEALLTVTGLMADPAYGGHVINLESIKTDKNNRGPKVYFDSLSDRWITYGDVVESRSIRSKAFAALSKVLSDILSVDLVLTRINRRTGRSSFDTFNPAEAQNDLAALQVRLKNAKSDAERKKLRESIASLKDDIKLFQVSEYNYDQFDKTIKALEKELDGLAKKSADKINQLEADLVKVEREQFGNWEQQATRIRRAIAAEERVYRNLTSAKFEDVTGDKAAEARNLESVLDTLETELESVGKEKAGELRGKLRARLGRIKQLEAQRKKAERERKQLRKELDSGVLHEDVKKVAEANYRTAASEVARLGADIDRETERAALLAQELELSSDAVKQMNALLFRDTLVDQLKTLRQEVADRRAEWERYQKALRQWEKDVANLSPGQRKPKKPPMPGIDHAINTNRSVERAINLRTKLKSLYDANRQLTLAMETAGDLRRKAAQFGLSQSDQLLDQDKNEGTLESGTDHEHFDHLVDTDDLRMKLRKEQFNEAAEAEEDLSGLKKGQRVSTGSAAQNTFDQLEGVEGDGNIRSLGVVSEKERSLAGHMLERVGLRSNILLVANGASNLKRLVDMGLITQEEADELGKGGGSYLATGSDFGIVVLPHYNEDAGKRMTVMGHELGHHVFDQTVLGKVGTAIRESLERGWNKRLKELGKTAEQYSFEEYMADQFAAYVKKVTAGEQIDKSAQTSLFAKALKQIKQLYRAMREFMRNNPRFTLDETAEEFYANSARTIAKNVRYKRRGIQHFGGTAALEQALGPKVGGKLHQLYNTIAKAGTPYAKPVWRGFRASVIRLQQMGDDGKVLAAKFHAMVGEAMAGGNVLAQIERITHQYRRAMNEMLQQYHKDKKLTDEQFDAELKQAYEELVAGVPESELAVKINDFVEDIYLGYVGERAPIAAVVPRMIPRMFNVVNIENDAGNFKEMLMNQGVSPDDADMLTEAIIEGAGTHTYRIIRREHSMAGFDLNSLDLQPFRDAGFLHENPGDALNIFVGSLIRQTELEGEFGGYDMDDERMLTPSQASDVARRRGFNDAREAARLGLLKAVYETDNGKRVLVGYREWYADQQLFDFVERRRHNFKDHQEAAKLIDAMLGRLNSMNVGAKWKKASALAMAYQNILLLAFTTFASTPDASGLVIQTKSVKDSLRYARDYVSDAKTREEAHERARALGIVGHHASIETIMGLTQTNANNSRLATKMNEKLFKWNGMEWWTNMTRTLGMHFAERSISDWAARNDEVSREYLKQIGLTPELVQEWVAAGKPVGINSNREKFDALKQRQIEMGLAHWVDSAIIRPNNATRPLLMNDAGFAVFTHLKGFYWHFGQTVINNVYSQSKLRYEMAKAAGLSDPEAAALASVPFVVAGAFILPLAALGYELRQAVQYFGMEQPSDAMDGWEYTWELISRSGALGPAQLLFDWNQGARYGKDSALSLAGPTAGHFGQALADPISATTLFRSLPVVNQMPTIKGEIDDFID